MNADKVMKLTTRLLPVVMLALLLAACNYLPITGKRTPYFSIPVGAELVLNKEVPVEPDKVRVYFQEGKLKSFGKVGP